MKRTDAEPWAECMHDCVSHAWQFFVCFKNHSNPKNICLIFFSFKKRQDSFWYVKGQPKLFFGYPFKTFFRQKLFADFRVPEHIFWGPATKDKTWDLGIGIQQQFVTIYCTVECVAFFSKKSLHTNSGAADFDR